MRIRHDRQGQYVDTSRTGAFQDRSRGGSRRAACDDIIDQNYGFSRDCGQFTWRNAECARHVSAALRPRQADLMRCCPGPGQGKWPDGLVRLLSGFDSEDLCLVEAA